MSSTSKSNVASWDIRGERLHTHSRDGIRIAFSPTFMEASLGLQHTPDANRWMVGKSWGRASSCSWGTTNSGLPQPRERRTAASLLTHPMPESPARPMRNLNSGSGRAKVELGTVRLQGASGKVRTSDPGSGEVASMALPPTLSSLLRHPAPPTRQPFILCELRHSGERNGWNREGYGRESVWWWWSFLACFG